jgi:hypothetical protein
MLASPRDARQGDERGGANQPGLPALVHAPRRFAASRRLACRLLDAAQAALGGGLASAPRRLPAEPRRGYPGATRERSVVPPGRVGHGESSGGLSVALWDEAADAPPALGQGEVNGCVD